MSEAKGSRALTGEELSIVAEEEALLARAREAIAQTRSAAGASRAGDEEQTLRALRDEYAAAGEEDRPGLLAQMHEVHARLSRMRPERTPDPEAPHFGHMRVRVAGRERDVLLGPASFVDAKHGVTIVEWRKSPIAEVFFSCASGEPYEIEVDGRVIAGEIVARRLVEITRGELASVTMESGTIRRHAGEWRFEPGDMAPALLDEGYVPRQTEHAGLTITLDQEQQALVDRDPKEPLLVLGSAGSGKTTVALHRVAALCKHHPADFPPGRMLVLVPEPGLRRLSERTLETLSVEGVRVSTFEDWIRSEARRVFPWLPPREAPDPPLAASRIKRHPGLLDAVEKLIDDDALSMATRIDRIFGLGGALVTRMEAQKAPFLAERLRAVEKSVSKWAPKEKQKMVVTALQEERRKLWRVKEDLPRLVGDRALLELVVEAAGGELPRGLVSLVAAHTQRQLDAPSEQRFAHVDEDRLATLDGRSLDDGTPEATAGTVDVEDYAILFELLFRKTGKSGTRAGELGQYAHIVLDEAQELAPIELRVIGRALANGGSVTVAGDAAQRIDRSGHFRSWQATLEALGIGERKPALLETSYRSPRPVVELAHSVLGDDAPPVMPRVLKEGAPVVRTIVPDEGHAALVLCEALRRLRGRDPLASIAVITRDEVSAKSFHEAISRGLPARLIHESLGDFSFGPGVEIAPVAAVKGLEFDEVVVPDATALVYPDNPESRRTLHVAVTRAMRRVWLLSVGDPSPVAGFSRPDQ